MKQVLQADDNGVIVYVAPTKALVNQIAAEIQARFSKTFKFPGKSVWAIHTREYRINNPTSAQILVTVPHILQIMLLNPQNAKSWSTLVRRIIFDEVHCIGQSDEGVVWEQLLLLAPCPIIALSATVGNPEQFENWLSFAQKANGHELTMIKHPHRYSDLRKFVYRPPETFTFNGLAPASAQLKPVGLDNCPEMSFVHPVTSLVDRSRGIPDDLDLEPRDCLSLWKAMNKHQTAEFPLDDALAPPKSKSTIIQKVDAISWQKELKAVLKVWMDDQKSPFVEVLNDLQRNNEKTKRAHTQVSWRGMHNLIEPYKVKEDSLLSTTLPLLCSLHDQGALPAILFNYDRVTCERIAEHLLGQLKEAETKWKESFKGWKEKVKRSEDWKRTKATLSKKGGKSAKRGAPEEGMTKAEQARDAASSETSVYESFDPEDPVDRFHFANPKKLTHAEFREHADELKYRGVPQKFIDALKRGIGIHHAGMNRKYRQVCEILFRKGYLSVVIATGTLALGINMPCKTVVFSGDSIYLTALSFRQAAGRAGRRGFDVLGNVVFQGIPHGKLCRLLSSRLPDLNGHFPITTSLVLRLMILLANSDDKSAYAKNAVNSLLSSSRICLGGEEARQTILHHLRFSIEYLRRNNLLDADGTPLNLSGGIAHLYYTENSSFAFHALFSNGYFHSLCKDIKDKPDETLVEMMLVLSHIFRRYRLSQSLLEAHEKADKKSSSVVVLPPLPSRACGMLQEHNKKTLDIYAGYVSTFVDQHVNAVDSVLPLSHMNCGGDLSAQEASPSLPMRSPVRVNSAFVALSGHHDGQWKSISELCDMVRSGVWLEKSVVPYVGDFEEQNGGGTLLNAYLYDFYRHGNQKELIRANGIRKSDVWFQLRDFSIILWTIVKSIEDILGISSEDVDMDFEQGGEEAYQPAEEDAALGIESQEEIATPYLSSVMKGPEKSKGAGLSAIVDKPEEEETPDSWEDVVISDSEETKVKTPDNWEEEASDESKKTKDKEVGKNDKKDGGLGSEQQHPDESLVNVLRAFRMLASKFDEKFKAIYA